MKAGEAILDARSRMRAAWTVLKNGHELPNIDPALDESIGEKPIRRETEEAKPARTNGANGSNGGGHDRRLVRHGRVDERAHVAREHRRQGRFREVPQVHGGRQRAQDGHLPLLPPARSERRPGSADQRQARHHARVEQLPRPHDAPEGARSGQGRHRSLRHEHDGLAARERLDEAPRGVRAEARRLDGQGERDGLHDGLPGEHRHLRRAAQQQVERRRHRSQRARVALRRRAARSGRRRAPDPLPAQRRRVARQDAREARRRRGRVRHHRRRVQRRGRDRASSTSSCRS